MFERKLFLGFFVDRSYRSELSSLNERLIALFVCQEGRYLQEFKSQEEQYLGRFITSPFRLSELESVQIHIYSLLKRLVPNYPYQQTELWLFPIVELSNHLHEKQRRKVGRKRD